MHQLPQDATVLDARSSGLDIPSRCLSIVYVWPRQASPSRATTSTLFALTAAGLVQRFAGGYLPPNQRLPASRIRAETACRSGCFPLGANNHARSARSQQAPATSGDCPPAARGRSAAAGEPHLLSGYMKPNSRGGRRSAHQRCALSGGRGGRHFFNGLLRLHGREVQGEALRADAEG